MNLNEITYERLMALNPCQNEGSGGEWLKAHRRLRGLELLKACPRVDWIIWAIRKMGLFNQRQWIGLALRLLEGVQFTYKSSADGAALVKRWYAGEEISDEELCAAAAAAVAAVRYAIANDDVITAYAVAAAAAAVAVRYAITADFATRTAIDAIGEEKALEIIKAYVQEILL